MQEIASLPGRDRAAWLFEPRPSLRGLVFKAIARDTRGLSLQSRDRFNCLPAFPFCALTFVFEGEIHLVDDSGEIAATAAPRLSLTGPRRGPVMSWSPGPVFVLSIAFYLDTWRKVTGVDATRYADITVAAEAALGAKLCAALWEGLAGSGEPEQLWRSAEETMEPLWGPWASTGFNPFVRDWARSVLSRAALSGAGRSARQMQRRLKIWAGMSRSELQAHARVEELFERTQKSPGRLDLAGLAADVGYADQSHMGREVKRLTGASPARINELIRTDERYWVYRLLGERF